MNKNDFNRFIGAGLVPGGADLEAARELTGLFPWFHSAHLVLLRGLRESSDIKFESQLKGSALYVADRSILYHYLFLNVPESTAAFPVGVPEAVPVAVTESVPVGEPEAEIETPEPQSEPDIETQVPVAETEVPEIIVEVPEEIAEIPVLVPESVVPDETQQEEPHTEEPHTEEQSAEDTSQKTRDELIAEIEARLVELEKGDLLELAEGDEVTVDSAMEEAPHEMTVTEEIVIDPVDNESPEVIIAETEELPVPETEELPVPETEELPDPETVTGEVNDANPADSEVTVEDAAYNEPASETVNEEPAKQLSANDLIDRFILTSPRIERMVPGEVPLLIDITEHRTEEHTPFITETLARIYVNQGYYTRAINIYEKLTLQFPEKCAYFASRIEKIKELIK